MVKLFLRTSYALLFCTGMAKLLSAVGASQSLDIIDPITGITFRHLMLLTGVAELILVALCLQLELRLQTSYLPLIVIAWISSCFTAYRLGLWLIQWKRPCGCLGMLTDALPLHSQWAETIARAILLYLLGGSIGFLALQRIRSRRICE